MRIEPWRDDAEPTHLPERIEKLLDVEQLAEDQGKSVIIFNDAV